MIEVGLVFSITNFCIKKSSLANKWMSNSALEFENNLDSIVLDIFYQPFQFAFSILSTAWYIMEKLVKLLYDKIMAKLEKLLLQQLELEQFLKILIVYKPLFIMQSGL